MTTKARVNIFELADQNAPYLENQCQDLKNRSEKHKVVLIEDFLNWVHEQWLLSLNMKDKALNGFLTEGEYKNVYSLTENRVEEMKRQLGKFYKPRLVFDACFVDGEKLKYMALNLGGMGTKFGPFCVVLKREVSAGYITLAFIKEDSLIQYIDDKGRVKLSELSGDLANRDCVHLLALLKHEKEMESSPRGEWQVMICGETRYIEAVTRDAILFDNILCIRIRKSDYDYFFREALLKEILDELVREERIRLAFFRHLLAAMKKRSIELEIIDGD